MKKTILKRVIVSLSAVMAFSLSAVSSADAQYQPARFNFAGQDLKETLNAALPASSIVFYCQSDVNAAGAALVSRCFNKGGKDGLSRNIESAVSRLGFSAASVNGQAVPVRVSYRVVVSANRVSLIPNLGSMQDRFGHAYIAPQERLDVSDWYQKYSESSLANGDSFLGAGDLARIAATVNEEGKPEVVRTIDAKRAHKRDANIVKNAVRRSRFIPGFVNGKPVSMGYLAVVNYNGANTAVGSR